VQRIEAGQLAGARGHVMTDDDLMRARAIEMIMCDFRLDLEALRDVHGDAVDRLRPEMALLRDRFGDMIEGSGTTFSIRPEARALTRIIASHFDAHVPEAARYSQAS